MLDINVYPGDVSHYHRHEVRVTEKRAPTDESVKLLREMEAAALEKILKSVQLENCEIKAVIHHMIQPMDMLRTFIVLYKVNGKEYRVDWAYPTVMREPEDVIKGLITAISLDIAENMLLPHAKEIYEALS